MSHNLSRVWHHKNVGLTAPDQTHSNFILPTGGSIGKHGVFAVGVMLNKSLWRLSLGKVGGSEHGKRYCPSAEASAIEK